MFQGDNSPQSHGTTDSEVARGRRDRATDRMLPLEPLRALRRGFDGADAALRRAVRGIRKKQNPARLSFAAHGLFAVWKSKSTARFRRVVLHVIDAPARLVDFHTGYLFAVLPRHFLIHVPHPRSGSKKEWLNSYQTHSAVDTLRRKFTKEIDARCGAAAMHTRSQVDGDFRRAKRDGPELKVAHSGCRLGSPRLGGLFEWWHHTRDEAHDGFDPVTGPASIAASLTASGDSLKSHVAAPSTPAAAIQSRARCAGDTGTYIYGIAGAAGAAGATRCRLRFPSMARIAWSAALTASLGPPPFDGGGAYV